MKSTKLYIVFLALFITASCHTSNLRTCQYTYKKDGHEYTQSFYGADHCPNLQGWRDLGKASQRPKLRICQFTYIEENQKISTEVYGPQCADQPGWQDFGEYHSGNRKKSITNFDLCRCDYVIGGVPQTIFFCSLPCPTHPDCTTVGPCPW